MDRRLAAGQPEAPEYEPGSPEARVSDWIKEYEESYTPPVPDQYETPAEVSTWFQELEQRREAAREESGSREEWKEKMQALDKEYEEKLQDKQYKLFSLRNAEYPDRNTHFEARMLEYELREKAAEEMYLKNKDAMPPRNLRAHFEETASAIAAIEGLGWARMQDKKELSLLGALRQLENMPLDEENAKQWAYQLYGSGGIHRWDVFVNGEVRFSKQHASTTGRDSIAQARRSGFRVG